MKTVYLISFWIVVYTITVFSQVASHVVIAEIYGGGGNSGSYYKFDYIILYNPTASSVDLSTWSIQYAASTSSLWKVTNLSGTIAANSYYSIQEDSGSSGGADLPFTPNDTGTISMSATAGKVGLVNDQVTIDTNDVNIVDFVGYGSGTNEYEGTSPAPSPSNTSSIRRKDNSGNNTYGTNGSGWDSNNNQNDFYVETDLVSNAPLPVELSLFTAKAVDEGIKLIWRTETEINNYGFEIERNNVPIDYLYEEDKDNWQKIDFVKGNGNSNIPHEYTFLDKSITLPGKYSYRLKQIDLDGKFQFSSSVEVEFFTNVKYTLQQNYPNPFNSTTVIQFSLKEASHVKLSVYNLLGRTVQSVINEYKHAGVYNIKLNAEKLSSGVYFYKIETPNYYAIKKMILLR